MHWTKTPAGRARLAALKLERKLSKNHSGTTTITEFEQVKTNEVNTVVCLSHILPLVKRLEVEIKEKQVVLDYLNSLIGELKPNA